MRTLSAGAGLLAIAVAVLPLGAQSDVGGPMTTPRPPSPAVAVLLSGGTLVLGTALATTVARQTDDATRVALGTLTGALLIGGPSAGFVYGGQTRRGLRSTMLRAGCVGAMGVGLLLFNPNPIGWALGDRGAAPEVGMALLVGGGLVAAGSVLVDLFTVGPTVARAGHPPVTIALAPGGLAVTWRPGTWRPGTR